VSMTWAQLQDEHARVRIGPGIIAEIEACTKQVVRRYDPVVYGGVGDWRDGWQDVAQEFVADVLLRQGQLRTIMGLAVSLDHFRRLLRRQLHYLLAQIRRRTVVDNLLDRCKLLLAKEPFQASPLGRGRVTYAIGEAEEREPTDAERWKAARLVAAIPTAPLARGERASMVFTTEALEAALRTIAATLPSRFGLSDAGKIFAEALTDWLRSPLTYDGNLSETPVDEAGPMDVAVGDETVAAILRDLGRDDRLILRRKLAGVSDQEVAEEVGVSRPTLAKRKQLMLDGLQVHLVDLDRSLQERVIAALELRLSLEEGRDD